jgi:dTDP-glucose 4,6-dehydratase
MLKLFVTGGAGFIGSAFIRLALSENTDCHITNFDALTYAGNPDNLEGLDQERHHFTCGDISDREAVLAALTADTEIIVNFAAESPSSALRFCWTRRGRAMSNGSSTSAQTR